MSDRNNGSTTVLVKDLSEDRRWALANRIASSPGFAKAAQLRELLLYLCKQAILDPSADMSEQEIGSRVLGRRPDYDTQSDNIVRVQVRHLRQKLDEYFRVEGRDETMVVSIPKGGRAPVFQVRETPVEQPPEPVPVQAVKVKSRRAALVVLLLAFAGAAFYLGRESAVLGSRVTGELSRDPLWARVFERNEPTTIVISDSNLAFVQDILHSDLNVEELSNGGLRKLIERVPDDKTRAILKELTVRQYTSMADATVANRLAMIGGPSGSKVTVRYSRHLGIRDLNAGNFVIVGSRRGVPWVELFEPELNFGLQIAGVGRQSGFRNKRPQAGESALYTTVKYDDGRYETYAIICFLPNLKRTGDALLLEGIMMEGTEAAGEFAMSKTFTRLLADKFGATTPEKLPPFEVLLRIQAMSGAPNKVDVVAWRRPGEK